MFNPIKFYTDERGSPRMGRIGGTLGGALVILLFLLWLSPFHIVPTGYRGVVTQWGAIRGIENEGLVILPPWQRLDNFNVRSETAAIENAEGATNDTQPVRVSMTVRYAIFPNKVAEVFEKYSRNGDLADYVNTATQEVFKAVTARYSAPDLIAKRDDVSKAINAALGQKLAVYGAYVVNIDMRSFAFSNEYMAAINKKVTQDQLLQAAEKEALTVAAQQKQKVITAEAEANAAKASADGNAYSKLKIATAEAEALRITNAALAQSKDVLELERIKVARIEAEKWNGQKVPNQFYGTAPIPFAK